MRDAVPRRTEIPVHIVRAAVALFSRQGYHGTTTREIARLANVSEVTIFRYFECKEDIFWSALISSFNAAKPRRELLSKILRGDSPEVVLPQIVSTFADAANFSPELLRLIAIAFLEIRGRAEEICREHLTPLLTVIANYIEGQVVSGNVRQLDPVIMTTAIALTVMAQPELSKVLEGCRLSKLGSRNAVDQYTSFWLKVLVPSEEEARGFTRGDCVPAI
jgi:AcrR family transcriptional regulator